MENDKFLRCIEADMLVEMKLQVIYSALELKIKTKILQIYTLSSLSMQGIGSIDKMFIHLPQTEQKKRIVVTETREFKAIA